MNRKQREKNKQTAKWLRNQQPCPRCSNKGRHLFTWPISLQDIMDGKTPRVEWSCDK